MIRNFSARARFLCIIACGVWGAGGGGQEAGEIQIPPNLLAFACLHQFHFAKADLSSDPSRGRGGSRQLWKEGKGVGSGLVTVLLVSLPVAYSPLAPRSAHIERDLTCPTTASY